MEDKESGVGGRSQGLDRMVEGPRGSPQDLSLITAFVVMAIPYHNLLHPLNLEVCLVRNLFQISGGQTCGFGIEIIWSHGVHSPSTCRPELPNYIVHSSLVTCPLVYSRFDVCLTLESLSLLSFINYPEFFNASSGTAKHKFLTRFILHLRV